MNVEVRLFATFAAFLPSEARVAGATLVEVPDRSTVADVAVALGIPGGMSRVVLVNGLEAAEGHKLAAGDVVTLFPPLAGGASPTSAVEVVNRPRRPVAPFVSGGAVGSAMATTACSADQVH